MDNNSLMICAVILAATTVSYVLILRLQERGIIRVVAHARRPFGPESGQDLIEYSLMAAFVAVAAVAIMPGVAAGIKMMFAKTGGILVETATVPQSENGFPWVRIACTILAIFFLGLLILRRRGGDGY